MVISFLIPVASRGFFIAIITTIRLFLSYFPTTVLRILFIKNLISFKILPGLAQLVI